ncbi:MAG TPA: NAD-dependent epimerase/dehydratase family protein [Verrucomicrobiae bacterium]|nr:NAD-dependent epimerase/dehydratase family protein [Verrucomicrobiae bacterium]
MRIAITGGTGFVGRNVARVLIAQGHSPVVLARGFDHSDPKIREQVDFIRLGLDNTDELTTALSGCEAVIHCAGINREVGNQTFKRVHVAGTALVIEACRRAQVRKVVLISFLRARPNCGSGYHESKWAAEELVRRGGLDYTILKCGVIYGQGDHMLNHLSHAFYTFPAFAFVGFRDMPIRPNAVEDVARIVALCAATNALPRKTAAVLGPETLTLREAVRRVAEAAGRKPIMFPMPLWFHRILGLCLERLMEVPMVSRAQVRMLAEGLAEPAPECDAVPPEIAPRIRFTPEQIRKGLPRPGPFTLRDLRCCKLARHSHTSHSAHKRVFFEMP